MKQTMNVIIDKVISPLKAKIIGTTGNQAEVNGNGELSVNITSIGGGITSHVIVDSSALPNGASTAANQSTEITKLTSIDGKLDGIAGYDGTVSVSNFPDTQPVSGTVGISTMKPDGTNTMPSLDAVARPGYMIAVETTPTDSAKKNPSIAMSWTNGQLTTLSKVIGGTTYSKTLTWTAGELTAISAWS